jgi:hypothetical protein
MAQSSSEQWAGLETHIWSCGREGIVSKVPLRVGTDFLHQIPDQQYLALADLPAVGMLAPLLGCDDPRDASRETTVHIALAPCAPSAPPTTPASPKSRTAQISQASLRFATLRFAPRRRKPERHLRKCHHAKLFTATKTANTNIPAIPCHDPIKTRPRQQSP